MHKKTKILKCQASERRGSVIWKPAEEKSFFIFIQKENVTIKIYCE